MRLILEDKTCLFFTDDNHAKKLFSIVPTENLERLIVNQDPETKKAITLELEQRKIIFNELQDCFMIEQKYHEDHDKIPGNTILLVGWSLLIAILLIFRS